MDIIQILIYVFIFFLGALAERIFNARCKELFPLGSSWDWSKNKYYRKLHRLYCECCPRRFYCKRYLKEITRKEKENNEGEVND